MINNDLKKTVYLKGSVGIKQFPVEILSVFFFWGGDGLPVV